MNNDEKGASRLGDIPATKRVYTAAETKNLFEALVAALDDASQEHISEVAAAIEDILGDKVIDADLVHKSGAETISGHKTFENGVSVTGVLAASGSVSFGDTHLAESGSGALLVGSNSTSTPQIVNGSGDSVVWHGELAPWIYGSDTSGMGVILGSLVSISGVEPSGVADALVERVTTQYLTKSEWDEAGVLTCSGLEECATFSGLAERVSGVEGAVSSDVIAAISGLNSAISGLNSAVNGIYETLSGLHEETTSGIVDAVVDAVSGLGYTVELDAVRQAVNDQMAKANKKVEDLVEDLDAAASALGSVAHALDDGDPSARDSLAEVTEGETAEAASSGASDASAAAGTTSAEATTIQQAGTFFP